MDHVYNIMCITVHSPCDEKSLIKGAGVFKQTDDVLITK